MGKLTHTVKGPIASFRSADVAPIESLKLHFLPKQEGSGDPSPTNIRPITGWTGCNLKRAKKNLYSYSESNIERLQVYISQSQYVYRTIYRTGLPSEKYVVNASIKNGQSRPTADSPYVMFNVGYYLNGVCYATGWIIMTNKEGPRVVNVPVGGELVIISTSDSEWNMKRWLTVYDVQIELGENNTNIEEYEGSILPLSWSSHGVEYGGYIDPVKGKLVAEWELLTLKNKSWYNYSAFKWFALNINKDKYTDVYCNCFPVIDATVNPNLRPNECITVYHNGASYADILYFWKTDGDFESAVDFNNWLNGLDYDPYVVYKLKNPIEYDLTPQQIQTFLDYNNFWSDMNDDTEVEYEFADHFLFERKRIYSFDFEEYIKDGLVLWMDGIDKGDVQNAWVDKIGGHVFTAYNNPTFASDHIELNGVNQYFTSSEAPTVGYSIGTIEVAIQINSNNDGIVYMPKLDGLAFGKRYTTTDSQIIWSAGSSNNARKTMLYVTSVESHKLFSINEEFAMVDGAQASLDIWSDGNYWGGTDEILNYIGRRLRPEDPRYFSGSIYSIRIYNRKLSKSEMLHNQYVDNRRFNLGISSLK